MHPELPRKRVRTDASPAGCSHSVHFLARPPCSRSLLWFRRSVDQRVISLVFGLCIVADTLIPCRNQPLDPWSSVPAALNCFHRKTPGSPWVFCFLVTNNRPRHGLLGADWREIEISFEVL